MNHHDQQTGEGSTWRDDQSPRLVGVFSASTGGFIEIPPDAGTIEFIQLNGTGWKWQYHSAIPSLPVPKAWPAPPGRQINLIAPAANPGTLLVLFWPRRGMAAAARLAGAVGAIDQAQAVFLVSPGGGVQTPSQVVADGLTTATAGGVQLPSSAAGVTTRFVTDPANAGAVVIADTQAKAALLQAAGGGFPYSASADDTWTGVAFVASSGGAQKVYSGRMT